MKTPNKTLICLEITKENYKKNYSLRARIGIRICQIIGILELNFIPSNQANEPK